MRTHGHVGAGVVAEGTALFFVLATVVAQRPPATALPRSMNTLLIVVVGLPRDIVKDLQLHFNRWFQLAPLELATP